MRGRFVSYKLKERRPRTYLYLWFLKKSAFYLLLPLTYCGNRLQNKARAIKAVCSWDLLPIINSFLCQEGGPLERIIINSDLLQFWGWVAGFGDFFLNFLFCYGTSEDVTS